ncbi:hypothetical protein HUU05_25220 [candidate division KSB1 bacterium]|nr:hypothetical protein [candidate division KSB1 bacterium]
MTAEVGVMNGLGVALAADSAVTIGATADKIYPSADKLFKLSEEPPLGIMIYGSGSFLGIPWEPIIASYRKKLENRAAFTHAEEYAKGYVRHLKTYLRRHCTPVEQNGFVALVALYFFYHLRARFRELSEERIVINQNPVDNANAAMSIFLDLLADELRVTTNSARLHALPNGFERSFKNRYRRIIIAMLEYVFENFFLQMSASTKRRIVTLIAKLVTHRRAKQFAPIGVVIAGFGKDDVFPKLVEICITGVIGERFLHVVNSITVDREHPSHVEPFAQSEMAFTFLHGIHPDIRRFVERNLNPQARANWDRWLRNYADGINKMVSSLPKGELGALAEFLVNLTKVKHHVSKQPETVGGPIDVAVISRADGIVWIQRKHYFKAELNPQYFERKNKERIKWKKG